MTEWDACPSPHQRTKKEPAPGCSNEEVVGGQCQHLHDARQLLNLILTREQWVPGVQLRQDATWGEARWTRKECIGSDQWSYNSLHDHTGYTDKNNNVKSSSCTYFWWVFCQYFTSRHIKMGAFINTIYSNYCPFLLFEVHGKLALESCITVWAQCYIWLWKCQWLMISGKVNQHLP